MDARDIARMLMLGALWGGSFAFMRVAVPALGPIWLAACRVALAFAALLAVAWLRRDVPSLRAHWRGYLAVGALNSALPFALFAFAAQYISASTAAVLNATSPFFGAIVGALWLHDPLTARKLAGMSVGFVGVGLLVGWQNEPLNGAAQLAILACLAAALCYALAGAFIKSHLHRAPSFGVALYSQLGAALVLAPAIPFVAAPAAVTIGVVGCVIALALLSTAVAYLLYFRLIADIGPARALTVTFLIPLFGALWGFLFLGEPVASSTVVGGAMILGGTWLASRGGGRRETAARRADQGSA